MSTIAIRFEWPIDTKGYRYVEPPDETEKSGGHHKTRSTLLTGKPAALIQPVGGKVRWERPLDYHKTLFKQFSELDGTPESCVKFANTFGPLINPDTALRGDTLAFWQEEIKKMKNAIELWEKNNRAVFQLDHVGKQLANLSAVLFPGEPDGRPVLNIIPNSLRSALWLQFAQWVSSDHEIRTCAWCGTWFETGPGTGRRGGARFCSGKHRANYHNDRRTKGDSK